MRYRVVATFRDLRSGLYVEAGAKCPELDAETAERLVYARCIVAEQEPAPESPAPTSDAPPPAPPAPSDAPPPAGRKTTKGRRSRGAARTGTDAASE